VHNGTMASPSLQAQLNAVLIGSLAEKMIDARVAPTLIAFKDKMYLTSNSDQTLI